MWLHSDLPLYSTALVLHVQQAMFGAIDTDKDGYISVQEVQEAFQRQGAVVGDAAGVSGSR